MKKKRRVASDAERLERIEVEHAEFEIAHSFTFERIKQCETFSAQGRRPTMSHGADRCRLGPNRAVELPLVRKQRRDGGGSRLNGLCDFRSILHQRLKGY